MSLVKYTFNGRGLDHRRILVKMYASCSVAGRRNVAWSTLVTGVTSGPAASIEVGYLADTLEYTAVYRISGTIARFTAAPRELIQRLRFWSVRDSANDRYRIPAERSYRS